MSAIELADLQTVTYKHDSCHITGSCRCSGSTPGGMAESNGQLQDKLNIRHVAATHRSCQEVFTLDRTLRVAR